MISDENLDDLLKTAERERAFTYIRDVEAICELVQEIKDRRYIEKHPVKNSKGVWHRIYDSCE